MSRVKLDHKQLLCLLSVVVIDWSDETLCSGIETGAESVCDCDL